MHIEVIKEVLAWAMNKYFQFSNNIVLLKTISYVPKNKAVLSFKITSVQKILNLKME